MAVVIAIQASRCRTSSKAKAILAQLARFEVQQMILHLSPARQLSPSPLGQGYLLAAVQVFSFSGIQIPQPAPNFSNTASLKL